MSWTYTRTALELEQQGATPQILERIERMIEREGATEGVRLLLDAYAERIDPEVDEEREAFEDVEGAYFAAVARAGRRDTSPLDSSPVVF